MTAIIRGTFETSDMKNPNKFHRGLFIVFVGFVVVGVFFTISKWPAASLFTVIGGVGSLFYYAWFSRISKTTGRSLIVRHVAITAFILGQVLKAFGIEFGTYFIIVSLISFLVWLVWAVLENLPSEEE